MNLVVNSRIFAAFLSILLIPNLVTAQHCNYVTLVKCFINILDEWTWTLYELKDNVVTINEDQCEHLRQLDKCIQDDGPEPHECNHNEIVAASNTVSDLLTHRKNSGSFLKSYYLLTYACSPEGQSLLSEHRTCLSRERIGEMTLSAGTYLSEKFLEHADEDVCPEVNKKLKEYMDAMSGLCQEEAAQIMCKSLTNMFKGLHADKLHNCEFNCLKDKRVDQMHNHVKNLNRDDYNNGDSYSHHDDAAAHDDEGEDGAAAADVRQGHAASVNGHHLNGAEWAGGRRAGGVALLTTALTFVGVALLLAR